MPNTSASLTLSLPKDSVQLLDAQFHPASAKLSSFIAYGACTVQIPHFSEANHKIVKALFHHSDQELLTLFQHYPEQGKFFTAIFCRYSPIVYTLIRHSARSPVQADYLFALTWRHIFHELRGLDLRNEGDNSPSSFQNWLINMTAICINTAELPPVEGIHYDLKAASPPLWCYVEQALDQLDPMLRLMVVMSQTFQWSETRIAAYLQAEGEVISPHEVRSYLNQGNYLLEAAIPEDIRAIYLGHQLNQPMSESVMASVPVFKK